MKVEYWALDVMETDFGSSTGIAVKFENDKVVESLDTSTYVSNYSWDGGFQDGSFVGETKESLQQIMDTWFDDFDDDYRNPFILKTEISANEWMRIKLEKQKEAMNFQKQEDGKELRKQRFEKSRENIDKLAEKSEFMDKAVRQARKHKKISTVDDIARTRLNAYKEYSRG